MVINTFSETISLLISNSYLILFVVMTFGGEIVPLAAGFAASLGLFDVYLVFILSFIANIFGDLIYFSIGKIARKTIVDRYFHRFGISSNKIKKIESSLKNNPGKSLLIIKVVPPLPLPGLVLSGAVNMPIKKFLLFSALISFAYSLIFVLLGFYAGAALNTILDYSNYIKTAIALTALLAIILWIAYKKFSDKLFKKMEKSNF